MNLGVYKTHLGSSMRAHSWTVLAGHICMDPFNLAFIGKLSSENM